jgi:hypothetical protein
MKPVRSLASLLQHIFPPRSQFCQTHSTAADVTNLGRAAPSIPLPLSVIASVLWTARRSKDTSCDIFSHPLVPVACLR